MLLRDETWHHTCSSNNRKKSSWNFPPSVSATTNCSTDRIQSHIFLRSLFHKLHEWLKKMSQCHNFVSGTSTLCLQSQQLFFSLSFSFWDCKQNEEIPDTKLWYYDIFFKHLCNLWNKDPKKIWHWFRSVEQFVALTMCYTKKEQNYLCYDIILIKFPYK